MAKKKSRQAPDMPNRQSNMEPAEGSRESVLSNQESFEHGSGESELTRGMSSSEARTGGKQDRGAGITNRGDREPEEQSHLPERGHSRSEE